MFNPKEYLGEALGLDADNRVFDTVLMGRRTWELGAELGQTNFAVRRLELIDHQVCDSGVAVLTYRKR